MEYKRIVYLNYDTIDESSKTYQRLKEKKLLWLFLTNTSHFILVDRSVFDSFKTGNLSLFKDSFLKKNLILENDEDDEKRLWSEIGLSSKGRYYHREQLNPGKKFVSDFIDKFDITNIVNFFYFCDFTDTIQLIYFSNPNILLRNYFSNCQFKQVEIVVDRVDWNTLTKEKQVEKQINLCKQFHQCNFEMFNYSSKLTSQYLFIQSSRIDHLVTNSSNIQLTHVQLKLFEHLNLTNDCNWGFENVLIKFDGKLIKDLHTKSIDDDYIWGDNITDNFFNEFINTYEFLYKNHGLFSQSKNIKKYLNYYKSRKNRLHELLFWFNEGYTNWWKPLLGLLFTISLKYFILDYNPELFSKDKISLVPVFYSINLFKNVILNEISHTPNFWKILLVPFEIIYLFSVFSLVTYIKREFGFGKIQE